MRTRKQKRSISISIAIILLGGAIFGVYYQLSGNLEAKEQELYEEQKPVPYIANGIVAKMMPVNLAHSYRGTVQANRIVTISATADGNTIFSAIEQGKNVHRGDLLLKVDSTMLNAANRKNEDSYEKTKRDYQKLSDLYRTGNAMGNEVSNALLQMQAAAAQLQISRKQLNQTSVFAPISGIIVNKKINQGEYVSTGTPLASIVCLDTVLINIYVNENKVTSLHKGQDVLLIADAYPKLKLKGRISSIVPVAAAAGTFPVQIKVINNLPEQLMDGMEANVTIGYGDENSVLAIPRKALVGDISNPAVYLFHKNRQPVLTSISLSGSFGDYLKIAGGIQEGDTLLVNGQQNVGAGSILNAICVQQ